MLEEASRVHFLHKGCHHASCSSTGSALPMPQGLLQQCVERDITALGFGCQKLGCRRFIRYQDRQSGVVLQYIRT